MEERHIEVEAIDLVRLYEARHHGGQVLLVRAVRAHDLAPAALIRRHRTAVWVHLAPLRMLVEQLLVVDGREVGADRRPLRVEVLHEGAELVDALQAPVHSAPPYVGEPVPVVRPRSDVDNTGAQRVYLLDEAGHIIALEDAGVPVLVVLARVEAPVALRYPLHLAAH